MNRPGAGRIALARRGRYILADSHATTETALPRPAPRFSGIGPALALMAGLVLAPATAGAQGYAGAFLAAREASLRNDFVASTEYLGILLQADPADTLTLERATVAAFSAGAFDTALRHATALAELEPGNRAASLVLLTDSFADGDYLRALELARGGPRVHPMIDGLSQAWARMGQGRMSDALELLDAVAAEDGMLAFSMYCRALALAIVGDVEGALEILENPAHGISDSLNRRGYIAYAQLLGLSERFDDAIALIDQVFAGATDPRLEAMRAAYARGQSLPFDIVTTPAQGMAEVFAVMASAMRSAQNDHEALIYGQAALWINPAMTDVRLMQGQVYELLGQPRLAAEAYARIPETDAFGMAARMGQAQVLETLDQLDEAITVLTRTAAENPQSAVAQQVLGDFLRRASRHAEAIDAYTRAMELIEGRGLQPGWQAWFARAVAYERTGQWPQAEADFRAALALQPDQPTVLNYLGYSLVERGEALDEALEMIERAVAGEPDSGYIVDSLAWALFRLGRYDEALPHMERAVELAPTDPILNDHLGDIYWSVGRLREARFQWRRALSFGPSDDMDEDRVRRKLEVGLDAVRAEAGEAPLHPGR